MVLLYNLSISNESVQNYDRAGECITFSNWIGNNFILNSQDEFKQNLQ